MSGEFFIISEKQKIKAYALYIINFEEIVYHQGVSLVYHPQLVAVYHQTAGGYTFGDDIHATRDDIPPCGG